MSRPRISKLLSVLAFLLLLSSTNAICANQSIFLSEGTLTFDKSNPRQQIKIANRSADTLFWSTKSPVSWLKATPNLGKIDSPARLPSNTEYIPFNFWPKPANPWRFNYPVCIGIDNEGSIYVLDTKRKRVVKFDKNETYLFEITGLADAEHIAFDSSNNAYVLNDGAILKFDKSGKPLACSYDKYSTVVCYGFDIAIDSKDNLYIANTFKRVAKYDKKGKFVLSWGGEGLKNGQFVAPSRNYKGCCLGIVIDAKDNVYVADNHYNRIQKFDATGKFIKAWGLTGAVPTKIVTDGQWGASFAINKASGAIYAGHEHSYGLYVFDTNGKNIGYISYPNSGSDYYLGDSAVAKNGTVYFCGDKDDHYVYKLPSGKAPWVVAGGLNTVLDCPMAMVADKEGNLYVADKSTYVEKFSPDGQLLKKIDVGFSWNGGYLAVDKANNIYYVRGGYFKKFNSSGTMLVDKTNYDIWGINGIAVNSKNVIYVIASYGNQIWKLSQSGEILDKINISQIINDKNVSRVSAIAIDAQDNIYIANYDIGIYKLDQNYSFTGRWSWTSGSGVNTLEQPVSICLDASNNIYAAFPESGQVHKYGPYYNTLRVWGERGWSGGKLMAPSAIAVADNCVYVADQDNCRVQIYSQAVNAVDVSIDYAKLPLLRKKPTAVALTFIDDSSASKPTTLLKILVN